jgi:hypothetical protein
MHRLLSVKFLLLVCLLLSLAVGLQGENPSKNQHGGRTEAQERHDTANRNTLWSAKRSLRDTDKAGILSSDQESAVRAIFYDYYALQEHKTQAHEILLQNIKNEATERQRVHDFEVKIQQLQSELWMGPRVTLSPYDVAELTRLARTYEDKKRAKVLRRENERRLKEAEMRALTRDLDQARTRPDQLPLAAGASARVQDLLFDQDLDSSDTAALRNALRNYEAREHAYQLEQAKKKVVAMQQNLAKRPLSKVLLTPAQLDAVTLVVESHDNSYEHGLAVNLKEAHDQNYPVYHAAWTKRLDLFRAKFDRFPAYRVPKAALALLLDDSILIFSHKEPAKQLQTRDMARGDVALLKAFVDDTAAHKGDQFGEAEMAALERLREGLRSGHLNETERKDIQLYEDEYEKRRPSLLFHFCLISGGLVIIILLVGGVSAYYS